MDDSSQEDFAEPNEHQPKFPQSVADAEFLRAARHGNLEGVQSWLANGANPNAVDENGYNALVLLNSPFVPPEDKEILDDLDVAAIDQWQVFKNRDKLKIDRISESVLQKLNAIPKRDYAKWDAWWDARQEGKIYSQEEAQKLQALHRQRRYAIFETLVEAGVDINARDPRQRTVLMHYAYQNDSDMLSALIAEGRRHVSEYKEYKVYTYQVRDESKLKDRFVLDHLLSAEFETLWRDWINSVDSRGNTALHYATSVGDAKNIAMLNDAGIPIDCINAAMNTPFLLTANAGGDVEGTINILRKRGADVRRKLPDGNELIHLVAASGTVSATVLKHLVNEVGIPIDAPGEMNRTPLMYAILGKHFAKAEKLLEMGADILLTDTNGETAIQMAQRLGMSKWIEKVQEQAKKRRDTLVEQAPATAIPEDDLRSRLVNTISEGNSVLLSDLLLIDAHHAVNTDANNSVFRYQISNNERRQAFKPVNLKHARNVKTYTPGIILPHGAVEELLADKYAEHWKSFINSTDESGNSMLHVAALAGNLEAMQMLIEKGAIVDSINKMGETPLFNAVASGNIKAVDLLLNQKANWRHTNVNGDQVMNIAATHSDPAMIKHLHKRNIPYDAPGADDRTPLMNAILAKRPDNARTLVKLGARFYVHDAENRYPLTMAEDTGQKKLVEEFVKIQTKRVDAYEGVEKQLLEAITNPNLDMIVTLLNSKTTPQMTPARLANTKDKNGRSLISKLVDLSDEPSEAPYFKRLRPEQRERMKPLRGDMLTSIFRTLMANGADPAIADKSNFTGLHHAVECESTRWVMHFALAGVHPELSVNSGPTPLELAAAKLTDYQRNKVETANFLTDNIDTEVSPQVWIYQFLWSLSHGKAMGNAKSHEPAAKGKSAIGSKIEKPQDKQTESREDSPIILSPIFYNTRVGYADQSEELLQAAINAQDFEAAAFIHKLMKWRVISPDGVIKLPSGEAAPLRGATIDKEGVLRLPPKPTPPQDEPPIYAVDERGNVFPSSDTSITPAGIVLDPQEIKGFLSRLEQSRQSPGERNR